MKRIATKACACACALALAASGSAMIGCSGSTSGNDGAQQAATSQQAGYTFTDDLGNQVTVSTHERVVAGMGSFANIWELAGGTLVGASSDAFSDYHIESKAEKVGDFSTLNAESIIALNPDFVILTGASSGRGGGVAQTDLKDALQAAGVRVKIDESDKRPGWKFSEQEMRGIPLRIEIGPKDAAADQACLVRRDNREKTMVPIADIATAVPAMLETIQQDMFERAKSFRDSHTYDAHDYEEFKTTAAEKPGFIRAMWCGDPACEEKIKADTTCTSRCIPFEQEKISDRCVCCGKPAKKMVYWGKAY